MNLHFTVWIFIYGCLLQCHYTAPSEDVTPSDSSILNLVVESSTSANSDKLLKTTIFNSSDSFSLNNVNTESLHSNSASEECKSGDCTKNVYTSSSSDNSSSSASKILWNLVSTTKTTTESPVSDEIDSEEITVPLYFPVSAYSSNNSVANNSSFYSNDNELDSEINSDNNLLDIHHTHSAKVMNNLHYVDNSYNSTATSTEPTLMTTEILLNELVSSEENSSINWDATEMHPLTIFYGHNISDISNATAYTTTPETEDSTMYADDELNFTTYFSDTSKSLDTSHDTDNEKLPDKDVDSKPYFSQNSTTEMPYYDSEALYENDNSSSLPSMNYDTSVESDELKSKSTETANVDSSQFHTPPHDASNVPAFENSENNTSTYPDYETSLEIEELKSKISRMIDIVDVNNDTSISPVNPDVSTMVWPGENDSITTPTNLNDISSVTTETPTSLFEMRSAVTSEKYDIFAENKQVNEESTTESTSSFHPITAIKISWNEMTNNDSLENTDSTDITETTNYNLNLTGEEGRTKHSNPITNYLSLLTNYNESSTSSIFNPDTESTETADINSSYSKVNGMDHIISTTQSSFVDYTEEDHSYSPDVSILEVMNQNASFLDKSTESEDARTSSTKPHDNSTYIDLNINVVDLNEGHSTSIPTLNNIEEIDNNILSTETSYHSISLDTSSVETLSVHPTVIDTMTTGTFAKEDSLSEMRTITNMATDISTENISDINEMITDKASVESSTSTERSVIEPDVVRHTSKEVSTENYPKSSFTPTEYFTKLTNSTEYVPAIHSHKTDSAATSGIPASSVTSSPESAEDITTEITVSRHPETVKPVSTEDTETKISPTTTRETVTDVPLENTFESKHLDTFSVSSIYETESSSASTTATKTAATSTTTTTNEEMSSTVTETHREGKHIPFSSTLVRRTTSHPAIFNVTARTHSYPSQTDTTQHDLFNLRYNQIKAEELSPEERTNLINAVVKFSDRHYSQEELIERMAVIHLWLLHAVADEYKNATLNLPATNVTNSDEIEFENLPQILYVHPSPEVFLPNISFTFVVQNKWRNETFPSDIILTILNLHAENLKKILVDIEEIRFSQGLLVQKHDLMSVIIEKYGIILLSTCLITVAMIFLLICVVIYYRKKTRHSAHCLTDDKLHRNMQEAMGIDLNPAVIILQEEIREKAALNGNKVCSLDGDEGWLAPINDVPVEDNNAPFVQDTKL